MKNKRRVVWKYIVLSCISIVMIGPLVWMILTSLKDPTKIFSQFLPNPIRWENYAEVLQNTIFLKQYWNSIYIGVIVTVLVIIFSSMAGYAFARIKFKGNNIVFILILSVMMIPPEVTIIPLFLF